MLQTRKGGDRGRYTVDWLESYHTFSFAEYQDPEQMGFRQLRVINEDRVQPGGGFPLHPHRDMEILSLVISGALKHEDSLGGSRVIKAGGVQLISAGTGVQHSEYNPSVDDEVHFLQIWVHPERKGLDPGYQFAEFDLQGQPDQLIPLANREGHSGAVSIHQDVAIDFLNLSRGARFQKPLDDLRHVWIQVVQGVVDVNNETLQAGDGLAMSGEGQAEFLSAVGSEILIFDLA